MTGRAAAVAMVLDDEDPVLTFKDAVRITGLPEGTLRDYRLRGCGPPFSRKGRLLRIRKSALKAWMDDYLRPDQ